MDYELWIFEKFIDGILMVLLGGNFKKQRKKCIDPISTEKNQDQRNSINLLPKTPCLFIHFYPNYLNFTVQLLLYPLFENPSPYLLESTEF